MFENLLKLCRNTVCLKTKIYLSSTVGKEDEVCFSLPRIEKRIKDNTCCNLFLKHILILILFDTGKSKTKSFKNQSGVKFENNNMPGDIFKFK